MDDPHNQVAIFRISPAVRWAAIGVGVATILGLAVLFALFAAHRSNQRLKVTKLRGNRIVEALERFHSDHDNYPETLAELCPQYLETLPAPLWGTRVWWYEREGDGFVLQVHESSRTGDGNSHWLQYASSSSRWESGD